MTVSKPETVEVAQSERDLLEQLSWLTYIFDETGPNPLAVTLLKRHRLNATPSDGLREAATEALKCLRLSVQSFPDVERKLAAALSDTPPPDNEETEALREALTEVEHAESVDVARRIAKDALIAFNNGGK